MHPTLNIAVQAARQASKLIMRYLDRTDTLKISEKSHNDFVTEVDKAAENIIIDVLRKAYPHHTFQGEESGKSVGDDNYVWIIDPLDGTTNFIHNLPHFSVSIALRAHGKIMHGVIYDPIRNELFTATRGEGALLNDRKLRVSRCEKMAEALIGTGFPFKNRDYLDEYLGLFKKIFLQTAGVRRTGSAALDLAYVAAGRLDGFFEAHLKPWDMAAGILIIKEAGGFVSDFTGQENYFENGNLIAAGNSKIFKALLQAIKSN